MDQIKNFELECREEVVKQAADQNFRAKTLDWMSYANRLKYSYHFRFAGRPIIQYPQDMVAVQEIIWEVKPDLIIETGIAHGGSLILSASMLALLDICDATENNEKINLKSSSRKVIGVDIDIREHNRKAIEAHPMSHMIELIQGSSVDDDIVKRVWDEASQHRNILVMLDSNHTHEHVLAELESYAPLTSRGSYCVVFDTVIEDLPDDMFADRPWSRGDNAKTAVWEYLRMLNNDGRNASDGHSLELVVDVELEGKLGVTVAPNGYLKRI